MRSFGTGSASLLILPLLLSMGPAHAESLSCFVGNAVARLTEKADLRVAPIAETVSLVDRLKMRRNVKKYFDETINKSNFVVDRGFAKYLQSAKIGGDSLRAILRRLPPSAHVVDLGAGHYGFIRDVLDTTRAPKSLTVNADEALKSLTELRAKSPNFTGISLSKMSADGRASASAQNWFKANQQGPQSNLIIGKYFESISETEITSRFGKADLVTDYFGVFTYTLNLPEVVQKTAQIMKPGGEIWLTADTPVIRQGSRFLSLPEYLVDSGLFEKIAWTLGDGESPLVKAHLRRTSKFAYLPKLTLESFKPETSGPPSIGWTIEK